MFSEPEISWLCPIAEDHTVPPDTAWPYSDPPPFPDEPNSLRCNQSIPSSLYCSPNTGTCCRWESPTRIFSSDQPILSPFRTHLQIHLLLEHGGNPSLFLNAAELHIKGVNPLLTSATALVVTHLFPALKAPGAAHVPFSRLNPCVSHISMESPSLQPA